MILNVLVWTAVGIGAIFGLLVIYMVITVVWILHNMQKIYNNLPIMTWLTVEEASRFGISRSACETLLPAFLEERLIEVRPKSDLNEKESKQAKRGFYRFTVSLHEFRILHWPSSRRKFPKLDLKKLFPGFEPPAAPA